MGKSLFADTGVHAIVDGQFGSTGKGLFASYLAERAIETNIEINGVISNAGPNSGHTFYIDGEKHVLKQLPSFAVASALMGQPIPVFLSAGAIIKPDILKAEAERYPQVEIFVHPNAAVISAEDIEHEHGGSIAAVAGTRSGTGAALARKVFRDPDAIWREFHGDFPSNIRTRYLEHLITPKTKRYVMEVSQGFSLGINSPFYPKVTSRECTVMQGIADARIAPRFVSRTFMVIRTFPIRVGNVDGFSSGDMYPDQVELSWEEIGVAAELTTVTRRERRVFSFSILQFADAVRVNQPDFILVNFLNYLNGEKQQRLLHNLSLTLNNVGSDAQLLTGFGPNNSDVVPF